MIWAVALRNVWRNKVRSIVIVGSIALGIFAGIFIWAFYRGMVNQRIETAIMTESSNIQIHHAGYLENPDQNLYVPDMEKIAGEVENTAGVQAASRRMIVNAMAASAETGSGVRIMGIDPEDERNVTNIYTKIKAGTYFEDESRSPVLIGDDLAEKLSIDLRSRLVITLQTMDGTITSGLFRVAGIYSTANSGFDEMNIFVRRDQLSELIGLELSAGHELAVLLQENDLLAQVDDELTASYPRLDVKDWRELMPEVSLVEETMDLSMYIFMAIILAALIFGIVNTMLMAVLERVKELGMLMAVGMNKLRIFSMIVLETVFLALYGGIGGIVVGYLISILLSQRGIDLSMFAEAYESLGFESVVYPIATIDIAFKVAVMILITGILASIYPALKALRLNPAEALHIDV